MTTSYTRPQGHDSQEPEKSPREKNKRSAVPIQKDAPDTSLPEQKQDLSDSGIQRAVAALPTILINKTRRPIEIKDKQLILYQGANFFVRTTYRRGYKRDPLRKPSGQTEAMPRVLSEQKQRIAASPTRQMPKINLINPQQTYQPIQIWLERLLIVMGLLIAALVHSYNMFSFPRYELDEGTYMASAWAIINGMITPYPYGYGHPPLAWIQIAAWVQLTGGFFTFGNALNGGRVLMLLYALGCALLVYLIARRFGGSRLAALLAMLLCALSPLSLTFQRQVLLDNIGTFWLLLALYLLIISASRLQYITFGAIAFGIAILSKEVFIVFLPAIIYTVWLHTTRFQRKFALVAFTYVVIAVSSGFVLMAILKGELLPAGILPGDTHNHLSMFTTFAGQAVRSQAEGRFVDSWYTWSHGDYLLMQLSIFSLGFNLLLGWWNRKLLLLSLLGISFWLLLIRGGVVLSFYIIPLIPLIALNTAMALNTLLGWLGRVARSGVIRIVLLAAAISLLIPYDLTNSSIVFTQHPTRAQTNAMSWVRNNISHNAFIVINSYLYMDLREAGGAGVGTGSTYPYAHVYWNVAYDPELHDMMLQQNWDRIDYIVTDSEMLHDIQTFGGPMKLINDALSHSILLKQFEEGDHDAKIVIKIYQVIHKQALPVAIHTPTNRQGQRMQLSVALHKKAQMVSNNVAQSVLN